MYISDIDIVNDFYREIIGKKVLVLASCDVDSVCSCKILQWLFQCDSIVYTLIPVEGVQDMTAAFKEHSSEVKCVILVNCGGTIDILDEFEPEPDIKFFIVDSHRPTDIYNIYNSNQVFILSEPREEEGIPKYEDIFEQDDHEGGSDEDDNSSAEVDDDEGESRAAKRQRLNETDILRRREKRLWEDRRNQIMFDYSQFSYFGRSSSILLYELAQKLSKDNIDVLWWGIVGVTSQLVLGQVSIEHYQQETGQVTLNTGRLCPSVIDDDTSSLHSSSTAAPATYTTAARISADKDLALALYRHWTVEQSLKHSHFTANRLKLWTVMGEHKLRQLLAEMGLPLAESKQMFTAMDLSLRQQFHAMMDKMATAHNMEHLVFSSFTLHHGCRYRFQASDFVYAIIALLNPVENERKFNDCFRESLACLSRQRRGLLEEGIEKAKKLLVVIYQQVHTTLSMRQILNFGPFLCMVIQEGSLDTRYYSEPVSVTMLAHIALRAYVSTAPKREKAAALPLVVSVPLIHCPTDCLVVGVPPVAEAVPRNFFGQAFKQAAENTNSGIDMDYFDTSVIRLKTADRAKFIDALIALLS